MHIIFPKTSKLYAVFSCRILTYVTIKFVYFLCFRYRMLHTFGYDVALLCYDVKIAQIVDIYVYVSVLFQV